MPKKKATKTVKKTKKKEPKYALEIKVNDTVYKKKGKNFLVLIEDFVSSDKLPTGPKTPTLVKFSKGSKEAQELWHVPKARRTFKMLSVKSYAREVLAGRFEARLAQ